MEKELLNHGELPADAIEKACCFVKTEEAVLPYSFKTEPVSYTHLTLPTKA